MAKFRTVDKGGMAKIIPESKLEEYKAMGYKDITPKQKENKSSGKRTEDKKTTSK